MKVTIEGTSEEVKDLFGDTVGIKQIVNPEDAKLVKPEINETTSQKVDFRKTSPTE